MTPTLLKDDHRDINVPSIPTLDPSAEARFDEKFNRSGLHLMSLKIIPRDLKAHLAMEKELSRREGEEALARKILAISGKHRKQRGLTNSVRLEIITKKVLELIPGSFIFEEAFTPPQATPQKESHA